MTLSPPAKTHTISEEEMALLEAAKVVGRFHGHGPGGQLIVHRSDTDTAARALFRMVQAAWAKDAKGHELWRGADIGRFLSDNPDLA